MTENATMRDLGEEHLVSQAKGTSFHTEGTISSDSGGVEVRRCLIWNPCSLLSSHVTLSKLPNCSVPQFAVSVK